MKFYTLGLVGFPLGHSLSPRLHQAALAELGAQGEYRLYPIPPLPGGESECAAVVAALREGKLQGLNVTIPHKQNVLRYVDRLTPVAKAVGAVNTLYCDGDALVGENTDVPGFLLDLRELLGSDRGNDHLALVLGAGGSARAVVYALVTSGWRVALAARRPEQAQKLARDLQAQDGCAGSIIQAFPLTPTGLHAVESPALLVNTTPLGMHPEVDGCAWPDEVPLPQHAAVYDLVYNPEETLIMKKARLVHIPARNGLGMLAAQAALAFERWTGFLPDRAGMLRTLAAKPAGSG